MKKEINRRDFLKAGIAAGVGAGLGIAGYKYASGIISARTRDDRPNILMVTMDTTRYDRLGFNGYERDTSPNLDKIAEQGVVFHKNYSQAPVTFPSISSLMTSAYPSDLGVTTLSSILPPTPNTLSTLLKKRGYNTLGATGVFFLREKQGFSQGFDLFSSPNEFSQGISGQYTGAIRSAQDSVTEVIDNMASKVVDSDNPNFFWIHFYDPHVPYAAPEDYTFRFNAGGDFDDAKKDTFGILVAPDGSNKGERAGFGRLSEKEVVKHSDQYDGQILYTDHQIGRLLNFFKRTNLFDIERDLLILNADHGELLGEQGIFASHHGGYEEVTHVPLMLAGAGLSKGKSINALTANLDIVPTIINVVDSKSGALLSDLERKVEFDGWNGQSLMPLIGDEKQKARDFVVTELTPSEGYTIHTREFNFTKRDYKDANFTLPNYVAGFSPSHVFLNYNPSGNENVIHFEWLDDLVARSLQGEKMVHFQLFCEVAKDDVHTVIDEYVPYPASSLDIDSSWFWGESLWNKRATEDRFRWKIQVVTREEQRDGVLFDSDEIGPLEFKLEPTPNFNQLFDLREEPASRGFIKDRKNHYDSPAYEDVKKELERVGNAHLVRSKGYSDSPVAKSNVENTPEEIEQLKSLGYL